MAAKAATKSAMYQELSTATGLTRKQVGSVFDALSELIKNHLGKKGPGVVTIPGLLKLKLVKKKATPARKGRNPFTGETVYQMQPVDIDEDTLQKIAQMTGGKYYRADNAKKFQEIYAEIDKLEKTEAEVKKFAHHQELFAWIISPGLTLLLLEILLRHTIFRRLP